MQTFRSATISPRHCEELQRRSNLQKGLLRFARNDKQDLHYISIWVIFHQRFTLLYTNAICNQISIGKNILNFGDVLIVMEQKAKELKLQIELVPSTVWFSSIYQLYKRSNRLSKWQKIKNELFDKEGCRCWICAKEGDHLEAHEFWEYDDRKHVQKLVAIHHLCDMCHKIKHIGFWCYTSDGREQLERSRLTKDDLIDHFCKVNNCSVKEFEKHEAEAFRIWKERSKYEWKQDFGEFDPSVS